MFFGELKFSPEFEAEISRLKEEAEAWGRAEAIKEARDCGELDESEKNMRFLVSRIRMLTLGQFSDTLMNTETEKDEWNKKAAFYREEPRLNKDLQVRYSATIRTIVKEILAADQKVACEDPFLSEKKEETKIS